MLNALFNRMILLSRRNVITMFLNYLVLFFLCELILYAFEELLEYPHVFNIFDFILIGLMVYMYLLNVERLYKLMIKALEEQMHELNILRDKLNEQ